MAARVTLPGWDASRTDSDPKQVFGQFVQQWQASGKPYNADTVRAFVAADPRWEINPASSPTDPQLRVKQSSLDTWKPGTSIWQEVVRDAGPGGANAPQFLNAAGSMPAATAARAPVGASSWWDQNAPQVGTVGSFLTPEITPALQMPTPGSVGALVGR